MKKIQKRHRKPTGTITGVTLDMSTPGAKAKLITHEPFRLPEDKNLAETMVMQKVAALCYQATFLPAIAEFQKFPTDHGPDFILTLVDRSTAYAELLEIAPLGPGSYAAAPRARPFGDYIDHVINEVTKKNANTINPTSLLSI